MIDSATGNPFELERQAPDAALPVSPEEAQNPFEVEERQSEEKPLAAAEPTQGNPFEMNRKEALLKEVASIRQVPDDKLAPAADVAPTKISTNFFFWIILILLVILAMLTTLYRNIIVKVYRSFTNDNFLKLVHREQAGFIGFPYLLLYIFFFINAGVFLLLITNHYSLPNGGQPYGMLLKYISWVAGIFLGKQLLLNLLSNIFPISKEVKQYSFMITIFGIMTGLVLVPFNIIAAFAPSPFPDWMLKGACILIGLVYLFRSVRGLFLASRYISMHKFHFFMYLCTVEIAPVIVLLKLVLLKTGVQ
ncbi:MAG: DUF4271 domain-containing protein [Bacteroidota bacterium]